MATDLFFGLKATKKQENNVVFTIIDRKNVYNLVNA